MVSIAFADDNAKHRHQIRETIEKSENLRIVIEANNGYELIQEILKVKSMPDVVLVDINMPKVDGLTTISYLINKFPGIRAIGISVFGNKNLIGEVLTEGGMAYLTKSVLSRNLHQAIQDVMNDKVYIDNMVEVEEGFDKGITVKEIAEKNFGALTKRELEFLQLNSTELSYEEIAQLMFVSTSTIRSYYDSIAKKLNINGRSNLSLFAIRNGLVKVARLY